MVDLGFGGSIGLGFNGGDVRSVIKNATKDVNMGESKDKTILSSEDIKRKKVEDRRKEIKSKVVPGAKVENQPVKLQSSINDSGNGKINKINTGNNNIGGNFGVNLGGFNGMGEITNIKVGNINGNNINSTNNDDKFINSRGRITALKDKVDVDSVIEDLYLDVGEGLKNGGLANMDIKQVKNLYSELGALDDSVVVDMISDLATLYQKGLPLNSENLNKFKEYYPELKNVGYGFTTGGEYNMYQGGGFKEAMNEGSPTDLNKYGAGGVVAETVMNPLGEATTALDNLAQQIPQVDGHKLEDKLKKRLSSLTDEDIDRYYQRYKELTDQGKLKLYTTKVKGNTLVGQMWSAIFGNEKNGRKYQDVEGGFRQWLIDQVNNEVNGFVGDLMDAQYFDQNVGPNVGKMMMNIPGSAVKTTTAIARAITNPLDTVSGLWVLGKDAIEHARDGSFKDSILGQRYGSWEALAKAMEQDPVGVASDILAVAEGGSSLGKGVLKIGKGGLKGASFTTYVLGAERTSEGLLKIANRLEKLEGRISEFGKTAGGASDIGMRQLFYGVEKDGKMVGGLVNGLEKRAAEGDGLVNKAAGYIAKTQQPLKVAGDEIKKIREAGGVTDRLAQKITGKADAESKLFQAANPSINRLTKGIDYKNKKANMDLATRTIVESGYTPRTIEEWAKAHLETLNKKWKEFTDIVKKNGNANVKTDRLIAVLEDHLKETGRNITANQKGDIRAIQQEIKNLKERGQMSMMDLEDFKESINSETKNKTQTQKGDIYIRGLKKLSKAIGDIQNEMLSKAPDEIKGLKKQIGALLDTKDDVIKANVKNLKRKEGGGLIENYSRIAGVGDIIKGTVKAVLPGEQGGLAELGKGVGKVVLGKALGRAKDVDFLVKEGFKGLEKKVKNEGKGIEVKGKGEGDNGVRYKKDSEKGLSEDREKRLKEDKDYEDSQKLAYRKGKSTDKEINISNDSKVVKDIKKKAKNVGFITKIVDDINKKLGLNNKEKVRGYADLNEKTINLSKNPTDTTAQHEYFHAVFSVVDNKTKKYILGEAKKFLKEKLGREVGDIAAEEWLAESFGVYIRDKEIKLGVLDGVKGFDKVKNMVRDLFQRGYEWMQNYNMDRFGVNRLFNEIWGGNLKVDEKGALDLSYLFGEDKLGGNADAGLKKKDGLRYKKTGNLKKNDYTTTIGQEDRLLLGGLAATEGGMKQATHAEGGLGNRGPKNAHLERVSSSDTANFFEHTDNKGRGYIEYNNGGGKVEKLYKQHELFDGYSEKLNKGLSKYKENLVKINDELAKNSSKKTSAVIGKTGHGKDIMISKEGLSHIYKHGNLDFNTLINAINDPTNQKQEIMGGRYRLEVRLDDGDTLVVGLQPKERVKGGKVKDVNSRVDADLYTVTSVTKGKPRGAESLEVRLKRDAKGRELSKGQQEYFKDSKVRDVNGGLLRMFHGTPNKGINVFEKSKIGTSTDSGVWGRGFYFTPDESYAEKYTKRNGKIGEIKEAYIDIKKPFEIDLNDKATIDKFNESYMKYSPNLEDVWKKGLQKKYGELIDQGYEKGTQALKDAGYDGVIVKRGGEIKEVVAFEPNQIKNIDNLNPSISDDIRYKKTGKGEGVNYNSTNLYGKIDQNGLTKKEGGSFGKLGAKGLSQGNGLDRGANKGVLQETSLTKLGASKGGDGTSQKLVKVKDGSEMVKISQNLQNKQERGAFMDVHSAEEYNTYKNFTNKNKSATISVKPDGDIINFVSTEKGAGKDLMLRAIEEGGNKMDNYGVGLTSYYENFGFEPVARVKFNREYAPNNWNFVRDGEPDIFVMKHNGDSVDVVREKYGTYKHKTPEELDKLPVMEYDDALKYRDELQAKESKGLRYKKVYHGSPADFDKFDSSHMSEGEGNQAHGWGHYVAVDEKTGRHYADMKGEWQYKYDGKDIDWHSGFTDDKQYAINSVLNELQKRSDNGVEFDAKKVIEDKRRAWNDRIRGLEESKAAELAEGIANDGYYDSQIKKYKGWLKGLDEIDVDKIEQKRGRNLYEVEIPDPVKKDTPTGSNYLEEDGKITDKELNKFRELMNKEYIGRGDRFMEGAIYDNVTNGKGLYKELSYMFGEKGASKKLEERGYDGIHYIGERDGEAYVIFNDNTPQIQNHIRYKKDSTGRDLSKGQQEYFKDSKITDGKGKLLKVYHGTHNDFTVFDRNKIGETTNNKGIFGEGFYMTSKEGFANMYAGKGYSKEGLEGKVMEGYVNIKKPFMWNDYKGEEALANLRKELGLGKNVIELNRLDNMIHPLTKPGQSEKFRAALEKAGYDGVVFKYPKGGGDEIVAFNSNQFKNIDNLNPTKSEDIRYKKDSTDKRKDSYKMGLSRKAGNKLWEESINPSTGKKWTKEEIDKAVLDFKDEVLGDEKKLKQVYNEYIKNDELGEDVRDVFDIKGYINPDAVRPVVNKMLSEKYGVSDNILASVNHPASSKIADGIRDMIYDKSIEKAKKGEKVVVSTISGGGGSGKSKGPKALIKNGYIKDGKVDITLDVQKGADDLKLLIDKARKEGVLDKYEFDVAYVYAPVEDASKGVGIRTANQNAKGLGGLGKVFDVDRIIKGLGWGDEELDRVYKGRSLPMSVFEEGHKKSAGEKGLQGFVKMSEEMDNFNLIITKRNGKGVDVVNVKKGGEFLIDKNELTKLVDEINTNKNGGINMDRINKDMEKLYKEGRISRRQYMNLISGLGLFVILFGGGSEE